MVTKEHLRFPKLDVVQRMEASRPRLKSFPRHTQEDGGPTQPQRGVSKWAREQSRKRWVKGVEGLPKRLGSEPVGLFYFFRGGALLELQHRVQARPGFGQAAGCLIHVSHDLVR